MFGQINSLKKTGDQAYNVENIATLDQLQNKIISLVGKLGTQVDDAIKIRDAVAEEYVELQAGHRKFLMEKDYITAESLQ